mgnify:FL=1
MGNIVGLDLNIDNDYLTEAVKQTVIMSIAESLNGKNEIISQIVNSVLLTKVDKEGKISSYSSDNKYTLIECYVRKVLREIAIEEIKNICEERKPEIREIIRRELTKKASAQKFVDKFFDCMVSNLESTWKTTINVDFQKTNKEVW